MVTACSPALAVDNGWLRPIHSPAVALPARDTRATSCTCGKLDNLSCGIIASASLSATSLGRSATFRRLTASGIGGPLTARAKTNTESSGWTCPFTASLRSTLTFSVTPAAATAGRLAGGGVSPRAAMRSRARSIPPWSAERDGSSAGSTVTRRSQYFTAPA
ncbi:hypothetical protein D3C80_1333830 [compost metagenome]